MRNILEIIGVLLLWFIGHVIATPPIISNDWYIILYTLLNTLIICTLLKLAFYYDDLWSTKKSYLCWVLAISVALITIGSLLTTDDITFLNPLVID